MINNGDKSAFPNFSFFDDKTGNCKKEPGLTKREYIAAMVLASTLVDPTNSIAGSVEDAVMAADALIEHLERTKKVTYSPKEAS